MARRNRSPLLGSLVLAALLVPAIAVPASGTVLESVPLEGDILLDTGARTVGSAETSGAVLTVDGWPNGTVDVPEGVTHARWILDVDQPEPVNRRFQLQLCRGPCAFLPSRSAILARDIGTQTLDREIEVTELDEVGWMVRTDDEPAVDATVDGQARLIAAADGQTPGSNAATATSMPDGTGPLPVLAVGGVLAALVVAGSRLRRWLPAGLTALYHRIARDELLDHPTRERIYELIGDEPGIHFGELERRTDTAPGNLDHHLRRMVDAGLLEERCFAGYRCLFRKGAVQTELLTVADRVRSATAQAVLAAIDSEPGTRTTDLVEKVNVGRSTVSYHVAELAEGGLVEREPNGTETRLRSTDLGRQALETLVPDRRRSHL